MASWRKVVVSGSDANLKSLVVSQSVNATSFTGSLQGNALSAEVVVINSDTAPTSSLSGSLWYNTDNLTLYVRYTDPSGSTYWVPSYNDGIPLTASYSVTSSYVNTAQTASFVNLAQTASFALNGGVTQLLAGPNVTLSPTNGKGQVTVTANLSGSTLFNTATGSYGSFYDTTTQTNLVVNIPRSMSFNTTDITNGVSISGSTNPYNTYIKTENAGVYNIQFSAQIDKTDNGIDEITIWLRKNGIDLTNTATTVTLPNNNGKAVAAWNWFVTSAANDYYQIAWLSADTSLRLFAEPQDGHPGIPSVMLTVNRVDQFLSNTGSFSGSFNGNLTGSLLGTASYANTALTASYIATAQTASFVDTARTASFVTTAFTASYVATAQTASRVTGSNVVGIVAQAYTASYVETAQTASYFVMSNRPAFRIIGTGGAMNNSTLSGSKVTVDFNQGNHFNQTTGLFTAPITGLYQAHLVIRTANNNNTTINQAAIVKNSGGVDYIQVMVEFHNNTTMNHAGGSSIINMTAGDTLRASILVGSCSFDGNDNFSVAYIG